MLSNIVLLPDVRGHLGHAFVWRPKSCNFHFLRKIGRIFEIGIELGNSRTCFFQQLSELPIVRVT